MTAMPWGGLDLAPEQAIILVLARAYAIDQQPSLTRSQLASIAPSITSWKHVSTLLHVHRIKSLAYQVLRDPNVTALDVVPGSLFAEVRDWYKASFAKTVFEPPVLHQLHRAFTNAGIPVLSIKGLTLGAWLYDDATLREHDDIDLLVPADAGNAADAVLTDLGYGSGYRPPLYPGESPATASYQAPTGSMAVDLSFDPLHIFWQSTAERRQSFDGWWARRQEICIGQSTIPTPGPEDQFLLLARHLQFHGYFRVNWAVDLVVLLRRFGETLDWDLINREATRFGITGGVIRTLEILATTYGVSLPGNASTLSAGRLVHHLHRRVWPDTLATPREHASREQDGTPIAPRFLSPGGVHPIAGLTLFALDPRRQKYFVYLGQRVLPPPSWLHDRYGAGSYAGLLRRHWVELRLLRRRVRSKRSEVSRKQN